MECFDDLIMALVDGVNLNLKRGKISSKGKQLSDYIASVPDISTLNTEKYHAREFLRHLVD